MIDIHLLSGPNVDEMALNIAQKVKQRRLELDLTQAGLSARAGIPVPTYRVFERTGKISLQALLHIGFALNCLSDFNTLFTQQQWISLDEMLENQQLTRKRGKKQ